MQMIWSEGISSTQHMLHHAWFTREQLKQAVGGRPSRYAPDQACNGSAQRQPWAGPAEPDQPIRAIQPAGHTRRPPTGWTWQTSDRRQTASSLNAPLGGGIAILVLTNRFIWLVNVSYSKFIKTQPSFVHCRLFGLHQRSSSEEEDGHTHRQGSSTSHESRRRQLSTHRYDRLLGTSSLCRVTNRKN